MQRNDRGRNYDMIDMMQQINASIKAELSPITSKLGVLEEKVNDLNKDRVTRTDLEKMTSNFVQRDAYEARHTQLIDRDKQLEDDVRELRRDVEAADQKIHERLESGKQQIEDRIKNAQELQLSEKDRNWMRITQVMGALGMIGALFDFIFQHVHIQ